MRRVAGAVALLALALPLVACGDDGAVAGHLDPELGQRGEDGGGGEGRNQAAASEER